MRRILLPVLLAALAVGASAASAGPDFTTLAYHDVVDDVDSLTYDAITARNLAMHFDWLRQHGYRVVSVDDLLAAQRGERTLPAKAVLLTFDDGYRSFYTRVYPLLTAFNYPAVLSVVGSFLEAPPRSQIRYGAALVARENFVSWAQLREMQRSGLVEVGSHTYGLHTTIYTNPQGAEVPAAVGQGFIRRRPGPRIAERYRLDLTRPSFEDPRSVLGLQFRPYLELAIELAQAAIDYAYDSRTGRYETDAEYAKRVRADLERNSELLAAQLGQRPRVVAWPYGRWNEVILAQAREAGMPIGLTLDVERADVRELGRVGRFYATRNPDLRFMSSVFTEPSRPELLRGLCVNLDEMYATSEEDQDARLGRLLDRILAFRPNAVVLSTTSAVADGGAYFPTDRLPVRADIFSRAAWQIFTRTGAEIYAWLPLERLATDRDTAADLLRALAASVPFRGLTLGPVAGDTAMPPSRGDLDRWDPRTPRRLRASVDRTSLPERAAFGLQMIDAASHLQPTLKILDVVEGAQLRRPAEAAVDAVDYVALRWDGAPAEAIRKLKDLGWLEKDHWGRLAYWSSRGVPAEWRRVQAAGVVNSVYCPERLLDGGQELAAMGEVAGGASFPFRP
jgi:peptidoglycan/xylan/chitin deacetylase (PgdA/CDA1 family)